jgi:predicted NBD/HSP70 family sugar kinase
MDHRHISPSELAGNVDEQRSAAARVASSTSLADAAVPGLLAAILRAPLEEPVTRSRYAAMVGISPPTAARAARRLVESGLVVESVEGASPGRGRREIGLTANQGRYFLAIFVDDDPDLAVGDMAPEQMHSRASRVWAVPVALTGRSESSPVMHPIEGHEPAGLVRAIVDAYQLHKPPPDGKLEGIGILLGGHIDEDVVRYSPNIGGNSDLPLAQAVRDAAKLAPDLPVLIDNDANALARLRIWNGGANTSDFGLILLKDDGVGASFVRNGTVETGFNGCAGEVGHLPAVYGHAATQCRCGNSGCLETVATLHAIAYHLQIRGSSPAGTVAEVLDLLERRDLRALQALSQAAEHLGRSVASILNIVDPGPLVILLREELLALPLYLERVVEVARAHTMPSTRKLTDLIEFRPLLEPAQMAAAASYQLIDHIISGVRATVE